MKRRGGKGVGMVVGVMEGGIWVGSCLWWRSEGFGLDLHVMVRGLSGLC